MNPFVIGITGVAGSGKDTLSCMIQDKLFTVSGLIHNEIYSFADPLKIACSAMFDIPIDDFYDRILKEKTVDLWDKSPRELLIYVGTTLMREQFDQDIWMKLAQKRIEKNIENNVVTILPDIRFDNEYELVRDYDGHMIEIIRDTETVKGIDHYSEQGLTNAKIDITVINNWTLDELEIKAKTIAHKIMENR